MHIITNNKNPTIKITFDDNKENDKVYSLNEICSDNAKNICDKYGWDKKNAEWNELANPSFFTSSWLEETIKEMFPTMQSFWMEL